MVLLLPILFAAALPHLLAPWLAARALAARLNPTSWALTLVVGWGSSLFLLVVLRSWLGYFLGLLCSGALAASLSRHLHRDGPADSEGTGLNQSLPH